MDAPHEVSSKPLLQKRQKGSLFDLDRYSFPGKAGLPLRIQENFALNGVGYCQVVAAVVVAGGYAVFIAIEASPTSCCLSCWQSALQCTDTRPIPIRF
jgi:nitrogenase molybdenum-iron protein alpha/beta subunit